MDPGVSVKGDRPHGSLLSFVSVESESYMGCESNHNICIFWFVTGVVWPGNLQAHAESFAEIASPVQTTYKSPGCN